MTDDELDAIRERKRAELETQLTGPSPDAPVAVGGPAELDELTAEHDVVIVDFFAEWCGPCKQQDPILESVAAETPAVVAKVDIDVQQGLAQSHGVRSVPTLVVYAGGEPVERLVGVQSEQALRSRITQHAA